MAELLINQWGWIGDDPFLVRENECIDMDWIDIRTTPRKIQSAPAFFGTYASETAPYNDTLAYVTETIDWVVQSYWSHCYISFTNIDTLVAGSDRHITVGSNTLDYNSTTNPEWIRHFFFTYDNATNPIKIVTYSGWVRANHTAVNTSGWASPANIVSNRCTAVCYLWKGAIIFARGNKIYEFNPDTETLTAGAKIELEIGAVVKNIYYYNGSITIVYNIGNDCYIRNATYDGTTYKLTYYSDINKWEKCLSSTMNRGIVYWVSTSGIFQYSGQSQLVKAYTLTTSAVCSYNKGILRIGDWIDEVFIEYWVNKPWYWSPLTKMSTVLPIQWVTENYIITFQNSSSKFRLDAQGAYKASNYYITAPYTAGQFGIKKAGLWLVIWHRFKPLSQYTTTTIQCSITIAVQTDLMERVNTANYVTVETITDLESSKTIIWLNDIANALQTAGYSNNFGYIRFKITLNAWDPYIAYGSTLYRKTPEVFDFYISHEELQR